jgi:hypothetical protein
MVQANVTAAAVMSFTKALEDDSSAFYKKMADRWPEHEVQFTAFARDCERSKTQVTRTYQETISDALDATFSFEGLDLDKYRPDMALPADVGYSDALRIAIDLEETAIAFYRIASEQASLLATIPRAFNRVAKRREKRRLRLESLLADAGS